MNVTDLPIWTDCPYRDKVPAEVEIRKGDCDGEELTAFWHPTLRRHVAARSITEADIPAVLNNLLHA